MAAYLQSARCGGPARTSPMVALARRRVRAPSARNWKMTGEVQFGGSVGAPADRPHAISCVS